MAVWMRMAISRQQTEGVTVQVPYNRPATYKDATGTTHRLRKSEQHQQFMWKLRGCEHGLQHFKRCAPATLQNPRQLDCCFCGSMNGSWVAAGKRKIPPAEETFMQLVQQQQQSEDWCWQVAITKRTGCIDFYNWKRDLYLQTDDWYHFDNECKNDAAVRDCQCNVLCHQRKIHLVRVHHADLRTPDIVLAAVNYALINHGVVFTASYRSDGMPHVDALRAAVGQDATISSDAFGNLLV